MSQNVEVMPARKDPATKKKWTEKNVDERIRTAIAHYERCERELLQLPECRGRFTLHPNRLRLECTQEIVAMLMELLADCPRCLSRGSEIYDCDHPDCDCVCHEGEDHAR